ncbi:hypothetical protein [Chitinophaga parva]|nr:hypothetical protein [Chitinophaga parva]
MNRQNDARIFELITQKLLGTICVEDDRLLQYIIARSPQVKRCWDELYDANEITGGTLLLDLEPVEAWQQLPVARPQVLVRRMRGWMEQYTKKGWCNDGG